MTAIPWELAAILGSALVAAIGVLWKKLTEQSRRYGELVSTKDEQIARIEEAWRADLKEMNEHIQQIVDSVNTGKKPK